MLSDNIQGEQNRGLLTKLVLVMSLNLEIDPFSPEPFGYLLGNTAGSALGSWCFAMDSLQD